MIESKLLAHRGCWLNRERVQVSKKNSVEAIVSARDFGFGLETDIRDALGKLAISHDPVLCDQKVLNLDVLTDFKTTVAMNIKADGLAPMLLDSYEGALLRENFFYFDMSVPESRSYYRAGFSVASRMSEIEKPQVADPSWIWLDAFESDWFIGRLEEYTEVYRTSKFCFVSPELHGRQHEKYWESVSRLVSDDSRFYLCTDYPLEFIEKFG